jgi:hypothetical protein
MLVVAFEGGFRDPRRNLLSKSIDRICGCGGFPDLFGPAGSCLGPRPALDQAAFDSYSAGVRSYVGQVGIRAAWKLHGGQFGRRFRDFVGAQLAATPVAQTVDLYAEWQKTVQAMKPKPNG